MSSKWRSFIYISKGPAVVERSLNVILYNFNISVLILSLNHRSAPVYDIVIFVPRFSIYSGYKSYYVILHHYVVFRTPNISKIVS